MKYIVFLSFCLTLLIIVSCDTDAKEGEFVVGVDYLGINNNVILIDTLTVQLSTINFDSLITSNQSRILIGNYNDPIYGKVKSESYFELVPENLDLDNTSSDTDTPNYVYDSIAMILRYDRYYYGDTTNVQNISIHRLTQKVKPNNNDDNFYNNSSLNYQTSSIGNRTFYPKPNEKDSINITLDNTFGIELFEKLKYNQVTNYEEFIDFFKGVVIKPNTTNSSNVIGFKTTSVIRLYYSEEDNTEDESLYKDFAIEDIAKQFNNISLDRTGTIIQDLPTYNSKLPSELTNNSSYIQSGTGVACRIDFPHIKELKQISDKGIIVDAELIFKPVKNSFNTLFPLKDSLVVYKCDNLNRISGILKNSDETIRYALLNNTPDEFNENIGYKINIGTFLHKEMLKTSGGRTSLILTFPNIFKGVDRITIGNQKNIENRMKLKIYYISY